MKTLIQTSNGLKIQDDKLTTIMSQSFYDEMTIHVNHAHESIEEFNEDIYKPYYVAEECGNFARIHLVTASSEYEAMELVSDYLRENEEYEDLYTHIINSEELSL